jgi:large subunit ribosomal protein L3
MSQFFISIMAKFILGKKIEMSQIFSKDGKVIPITLIEAGPCFVTQVKGKKKDGYEAVQIGFKKKNKVKKSEKGKGFSYLKEFRIKELETEDQKLKVGDKIDVSIFEENDIVKISGISKGKGFQGAVKRWGFSGMGASHGIKHEHRTLGSVGSTDAARVFKGKKMPGRMGGERITQRNLKIAKIDLESNLIAVKGTVPGRRGTLLEIINR